MCHAHKSHKIIQVLGGWRRDIKEVLFQRTGTTLPVLQLPRGCVLVKAGAGGKGIAILSSPPDQDSMGGHQPWPAPDVQAGYEVSASTPEPAFPKNHVQTLTRKRAWTGLLLKSGWLQVMFSLLFNYAPPLMWKAWSHHPFQHPAGGRAVSGAQGGMYHHFYLIYYSGVLWSMGMLPTLFDVCNGTISCLLIK